MARKRRPVKRKAPARKPRISRKERQRRARISRSLRAYWTGVKQARAARIMEALGPTFAPTPAPPPAPSFGDWLRTQLAGIERELSGQTWQAEPDTENAAFLLRTQEPDLHERFPRNTDVTAEFHLLEFADIRKTRTVQEVTLRVTFNTGGDEAEFWRNYHQAARSTLAGAGSDRYAIFVVSIG